MHYGRISRSVRTRVAVLLLPSRRHPQVGHGHKRRDLILSCDDDFNYLAAFRTKCVVKGGKAQRTAKMIGGKLLR